MGSSQQNGFTLLELLVALAVFAVMSAMAYSGLATMLETRQAVTAQSELLSRLQMAFNRMGVDVEQMMDRPIQDGTGSLLPALVGGEGFDSFLEFTRGGWANPRQQARGGLQRVAYLFEDDAIIRLAWPTLDRVPGQEPGRAVILREVLGVEVRFLDGSLAWHSFWPPHTVSGRNRLLPRAVEIIIEKKKWGRLRRLFEVTVPGALL